MPEFAAWRTSNDRQNRPPKSSPGKRARYNQIGLIQMRDDIFEVFMKIGSAIAITGIAGAFAWTCVMGNASVVLGIVLFWSVLLV